MVVATACDARLSMTLARDLRGRWQQEYVELCAGDRWQPLRRREPEGSKPEEHTLSVSGGEGEDNQGRLWEGAELEKAKW